MALDFPSNPSNNQIYTDSTTGNRYRYDSPSASWEFTPLSILNGISNSHVLFTSNEGTFAGNTGLTFNANANTLTANTINAYSMRVTGNLYVGSNTVTITNDAVMAQSFFIMDNGAPVAVSTGATTNASYEAANAAFAHSNNTLTHSQNVYNAVNSAFGVINATFTQSNTDNVRLTSAYTYTNLSYSVANAAFDVTNAAYTSSNAGYTVANAAFAAANAEFTFSNTIYAAVNSVFGVVNAAFASANNVAPQIAPAFNTANAAFDMANTKLASAGGTITGDLVVQGNATFSGVTTYANTQTLLIGDNLVTLNADIPNNVAPSENSGLEINRGSSSNVSILWNEGNDRWTFTNDGSTYNQIASNVDVSTVDSRLTSAYGVANAAYTSSNADYVMSNAAFTVANAAFGAANSKVASVSGTSGRITSSGGTTPTIDLATAGAGAASYSSGISALTVDAYGRVTSVTGSAGYAPLASPTFTGTVTTPYLFMNRLGGAGGISWYSTGYTSWSQYMAAAGQTGQGPTQTITAPSGTYVTSWASRSFIENISTYGWTWESGSATSTTPSVVAEIRASDGLARFAGGTYSPAFYDSNNTAFYVDPNSTSVLNALTVGGNGVITYGDENVMRYRGSITSQDWNTYVDGTESGYYLVENMSGSNRPSAYTYGTEVNWSIGGAAKFQIYAPHNGTDGNGIFIRTGWNTDYDAWNELAITSKSFTNNVDLRAPIFYDSNNTAFYVDGNGSTVLNRLTVGTGSATQYNESSFTVYGGSTPAITATGGWGRYGKAIVCQTDGGGGQDGPMVWFHKQSAKSWGCGVRPYSGDNGFWISEDSSGSAWGTERFRILPGGQVNIFAPDGGWNARPALVVASNGDGYLQTRHIRGKDTSGTSVDHLYIQWEQAADVYFGRNVYLYNYYDRDDTNYFVNPNGSSTLLTLYHNGGTAYFRGGQGVDQCCGGDGAVSIGGNSTKPPRITWHSAGIMEGVIEGTNTGWRKIYFFDNQGNGLGVHATGQIASNSNVVAYYSDRRLKEDFDRVTDHWNVINNINGYRFTWNERAAEIPGFVQNVGKREVGLVAQEVLEVYPEAVYTRTEGPEDDPYKTILHDRFSPIFIEALKDLHRKIQELEAEIKELKNGK